jgi:hypothetical protein
MRRIPWRAALIEIGRDDEVERGVQQPGVRREAREIHADRKGEHHHHDGDAFGRERRRRPCCARRFAGSQGLFHQQVTLHELIGASAVPFR